MSLALDMNELRAVANFIEQLQEMECSTGVSVGPETYLAIDDEIIGVLRYENERWAFSEN